MDFLHSVSIFFELVIVIISLMIAVKKKKIYGYGFALTFAIYVFYDSANLFSLGISDSLLYPLFFIATLSALLSMWMLYKESGKT